MKIRKVRGVCLFVLLLFYVHSAVSVQAEDFGKELLNSIFKEPAKQQQPGAATQQNPSASQPQQKQQITYSGYAKAFMPIKMLLCAGRAEEAATLCSSKISPASTASGNSAAAPVAVSELGNEALQQGMKGPKVAEVQDCLNERGFNAGMADGIFGKCTKAKVMEFQRASGIEATGAVDRKTWDALHNQTAGSIGPVDERTGNQAAPPLTSEVLAYLEGGNLALCAGNVYQAVDKFACAENMLARNESGTKAGGWFKKGSTFAMETLLGDEEMGEYKGEGYEKVFMLNLKSIAYLLAGERKAYNVTRRAIGWQETEKRRFEDKIREAREKYASEQNKQQGSGQSILSSLNLSAILAQEYAQMEKRAVTVPSAYVNPFGYYIAGVVQEFESFNEPSLRDNALISYKKALELNPDCRALKDIVGDIKKSPLQGKRLVHVVAGDGFVPEKKLLRFGLQVDKTVVPVKLSMYVPVPSQVRRIEVTDMKGKKLATLSTIADVEAICLRQQKDTQPLRDLRVLLAIIRTCFEKGIYDGAGAIGKVIGDVREGMTTPDMRSWMSLPATMQIARFYVTEGTDQIKISTYDANGKKLASSITTLDPASHNFVSVRSIDKTLYVQANKKMWFAKN
ncbi:MAG: peptidoglycan-binding protein [Pseudomonadota bacterium]